MKSFTKKKLSLVYLYFSRRWLLLETIDKIVPGIVNWKIASRPPIKMPFRKVENCNQVIKIGKQLKFSLVNIAGNDIVQGNKKLILGTVFHSLFSWFLYLCFSVNDLIFIFAFFSSFAVAIDAL